MAFSEAMLLGMLTKLFYEVKTSLPKEMCGFEVRKVFGGDALASHCVTLKFARFSEAML